MVDNMFNPLRKVKLYVEAYADMIRNNKGKIDISIMSHSYLGAINCLRRNGINSYDITVKGKTLTVNIDKDVQAIHNFIKREVVNDLSKED